MNNLLDQWLNEWNSNYQINYLIHEYSKVHLGKIESLDALKADKTIKFDEIIEMRLFNREKELFMYKYSGEWRKVETIHEDKDIIDREYELENKFNFRSKSIQMKKYRSIKVRKYIDYEDDIAYVKKTCLLDIIEGA